jgi:hypothetical protein
MRRTLAEWHTELAEAHVTPNQISRLHLGFERLGYGPADRAARLEMAAAWLGIERIGSFTDLRQGQAGQLVRALPSYRTRAELEADARLPAALREAQLEAGPPGPGRRAEDRAPDYRRKLMTVIMRALITEAIREAARAQRVPDTTA